MIVAPASINNKAYASSKYSTSINSSITQRKSVSQQKLGSLDRSTPNIMDKMKSIGQVNFVKKHIYTDGPTLPTNYAQYPTTLNKNQSVKTSLGSQ